MTRIAILGCGSIARTMANTLRRMRDGGEAVCLYAAASRRIETAQAFAAQEGFEVAYGSYEEMVRDPKVDLVYVASPHSHHAEHMKLCLNNGKPVLCEKSFTANAAQAREVLALAKEKNLLVAEAIWTRYMPSRRIIDEVIASGAIGTPQLLKASLHYPIFHVPRITDPALAGGALLDVGIYPLNFASMVFGDDIVRINSTVELMDNGLDRTETVTIKYRDGKMSQLMASTAFNSDRRCVVYGTKGFMIVDNVNNPNRIEIYDRDERRIPKRIVGVPPQITGYEYEVDACLRDLDEGNLEPREMPHEQTLMMLRQTDALRAMWRVKYPFE